MESSASGSFVNGCRPAASIKTAVIRPITHLHEATSNNAMSASSATHTDQKSEPFVRDSTLRVNISPAQEEGKRQRSQDESQGSVKYKSTCMLDISYKARKIRAESRETTLKGNFSLLTDLSALKYGTNATCRRKSKVEAWIESSPSLQSEESLDHLPSAVSPILQLPVITVQHVTCSSSDYSVPRYASASPLVSPAASMLEQPVISDMASPRDIVEFPNSELDLSFENLCVELLALSASCEKLEQLISSTHSSQSTTLKSDHNNDESLAERSQDNLVSAKHYQLPEVEVEPSSIQSSTSERFQSAVELTPVPFRQLSTNNPQRTSNQHVESSRHLAALSVDVGLTISSTPGKYSSGNSLMTVVTNSNTFSNLYGITETSEVGPAASLVPALPPRNFSAQKTSQVDSVIPQAISVKNCDQNQGYTEKFTRSRSDPNAGLDFISKRASFTRSPSKRDRNSTLKVGMDVIRHKHFYPPSKFHMSRSFSHTEGFGHVTPCTPVVPRSSTEGDGFQKLETVADTVKTSMDEVPIINRSISYSCGTPIKPDRMPKLSISDCSDNVFTGGSRQSSARSHQSDLRPSVSSMKTDLNNDCDSGHKKTRPTHGSTSSNFESEAQDVLASLKATKHQHPSYRASGEEPVNLSHQVLLSPGKSSSQRSTPTHYNNQLDWRQRERSSIYDNVIQSPYTAGGRASVTSASSSGTVFSKPWNWADVGLQFLSNNMPTTSRSTTRTSTPRIDSRTRLDSLVSTCKRSPTSPILAGEAQRLRTDSCSRSPLTISDPPPPNNRVLRNIDQNSDNQPMYKFPVNLPDVTKHNGGVFSRGHADALDQAVERTLSRIRQLIKPLQKSDHTPCAITEYTTRLLTNRKCLHGQLTELFITCTQTHSDIWKQLRITPNHQLLSNGLQQSKADWYSDIAIIPEDRYSNGGYISNNSSLEKPTKPTISRKAVEDKPNDTIHLSISNTRQFMNGIKHLLQNQPDPQLMVAVQREKQKLNDNEFLNLDTILECVVESMVLKPLYNQLLMDTAHNSELTPAAFKQITQGMKLIVAKKEQLFIKQIAAVKALDNHSRQLSSLFRDLTLEFSPLAKADILLQIFSIISQTVKGISNNTDRQLVHLYALCKYSEPLILSHLIYISELLPSAACSSAITFVVALFEGCLRVASRYSTVNPVLSHRPVILHEVLEKECCNVLMADESTNHTQRRHILMGNTNTVSQLLEILALDSPEVQHIFGLYLISCDKEMRLRANERIADIQKQIAPNIDFVCKRNNSNLLLWQSK